MRVKRNQYRAIFAVAVLIAFFIPAYDSVSAFQFLFLALGTLGDDSEVTLIDLLVVMLPLLLIPTTAILILARLFSKKPLNSLLLCLPFFSIAFSFLIFSLDMIRQVNSASVLNLLAQMRIGFYLATCSALLLLLSYSRREYLNL